MRTATLLTRIHSKAAANSTKRLFNNVSSRQFHHLLHPRTHLGQFLFRDEPLLYHHSIPTQINCELRNISDEFDHGFHGYSETRSKFLSNSIDITNNENDYGIDIDLPGVKKENIKVSVKNGILKIDGERNYDSEQNAVEVDEDNKNEQNTKEKQIVNKYYRKERFYGRFSQSVSLPENALDDPTKIIAKYEDGVLNISVPKKKTSEEHTS
eukprot:53743_1